MTKLYPNTSNIPQGRTLLPLAAALSAALALAACAPIPQLKPAAQAIDASQLGLPAQTSPAPSELTRASAWWVALRDPQLDTIIQRTLAQSPSLAAARARIDRAEAQIESAKAADRVTVGAGFDATYQRFPEHSLYPPPYGGSLRTMSTVQGEVHYDWDFFGRHAAELNMALGQAKAGEADQAAAALMLSAQVARSYLALGRVLAQKTLLTQQINEREEALSLVRQRVVAGLDNAQDKRTAESPLPELRRQALVLDEQAGALRQMLASLSVQDASALRELAPKLPQTLPMAAQGPGLDLLGRRPDVIAARWRVEAAGHQVALARSQFYPNVSLSAFAGYSAIGLDKLLQAGSLQYGLGPSIRLPLFDTGRLSAQLQGSAAEVDAAVAAYNGAVLDAVRDASDQLRTVQSLQEQQREQANLLQNAQASTELQTQRFNAGLGNKLAVLNAHGAVLQQQRMALDLQGQLLESQVSLVRALGGDWHE
ncbi:efflux transporter outer membrane subunit [Roseateles koreensis]|uniref:Efflux transporter outer membrane subunit n=1 Tax=Roseateles koreensis TaxID=2987526 RepID=A0ABT5KQS5_9BURK|nr:efflux transporter outer membrane subunit [Roseateles koreensis]MDC8785268.1 efflux transporter outer membrane subunit [Roseateles koreensis]